MDITSGLRLLKLREILNTDTDESHEFSMNELIEKLMAAFDPGFKIDQRAVKRDMEALNEEGFEIIENQGKYGKILYSHQARLFETYQLRLLIDAVLSARFITESEKKLLKASEKSLEEKI